MIRRRDIHMLSCARMFFNEKSARSLALSMGISVSPVMTAGAFNFIAAPRRDFKDVWMDRQDGYYLLCGSVDNDTMLHQSNGSVGAVSA